MSDAVKAPEPKPVSDFLNRHMDDVLAKIPTGKRGQISGAVTTLGVEGSIGARVGSRTTISGWAGKEWGHKGWSGGVRGSYTW